ncbi:MAG: GlsB/YeaQ/YmgE family stress response membrane protein [Nocardioidaceae bacterium]
MLIIAIIVVGLAAGWIAHLLVGRGRADWPLLFVVGLAGSLVGGLLGSLLSGDGLGIRPSGIIGSVVGASVILLAMRAAGTGSQKPS